jgi:hypothetical protein
VFLLVIAMPFGLAGCSDGPAEEAGEKINDAVDDIDNEI